LRVRSVDDGIVASRLLALDNLVNLAADLDHGVAELVDVAETLTLSRFDLYRKRVSIRDGELTACEGVRAWQSKEAKSKSEGGYRSPAREASQHVTEVRNRR
jgi:hypothetical protein